MTQSTCHKRPFMKVINYANLSAEESTQLKNELPEQENLHGLMKWALSQPKGVFLSSIVLDVIVQDEFTHDVIVPYRDGLFLVYDTT